MASSFRTRHLAALLAVPGRSWEVRLPGLWHMASPPPLASHPLKLRCLIFHSLGDQTAGLRAGGNCIGHVFQILELPRALENEKGSWWLGRCGGPSRKHLSVVLGAQAPPLYGGRALASGWDEAPACASCMASWVRKQEEDCSWQSTSYLLLTCQTSARAPAGQEAPTAPGGHPGTARSAPGGGRTNTCSSARELGEALLPSDWESASREFEATRTAALARMPLAVKCRSRTPRSCGNTSHRLVNSHSPAPPLGPPHLPPPCNQRGTYGPAGGLQELAHGGPTAGDSPDWSGLLVKYVKYHCQRLDQ